MKKFLVVASLCVIFVIGISLGGIAAEQQKDDPFDLEAIQRQIEELGLPETEKVAQLETVARKLFDQKDWENAAVALELWAKNANWLANLITAGLEPIYSARSEDLKSVSLKTLNTLGEYEKAANVYKQKRNEAMVMQAECYINLGQKDKGAAILVKVLDIMSVKEGDLWARAMKDLYQIIGVN